MFSFLQAGEGLQLRGSSADQAKNDAYHLREEGQLQYVLKHRGYGLHCSTLLNKSRRHRARKTGPDMRERMAKQSARRVHLVSFSL